MALRAGGLAVFDRAAGALDFGVVLRAAGLAVFVRTAGVLDLGVVLGVRRFLGSGRAREGVDLGDGLEAVGCSRVCRGRAILR